MTTAGQADYVNGWVQSIAERSAVSTIVFLQMGSAYGTTVDVLSSAGFTLVAVDSFLDGDEVVGNRIVLTGLESLAVTSDMQRLGKLRIAVHEQVRGGKRFVLQSSAPRSIFESRGSLIVMDAVFATGPARASWADAATASVVFEAELDRARPFRSVLHAVLSELGPSLCARLDRLIYESGDPSPDVNALDGSEIEALRGAGLVDERGCWLLLDPSTALRRALTDVLDVRRDATLHLTNVVGEFDALTSTLRRTIRAAARARWGAAWASECLSRELAGVVVGRASRELVPMAESIEDIRDVLLWLTVKELLQLRRQVQLGDLGMSESAWRSAEHELGSVEDRLQFFGHVTRQDEACVKKWSSLFAQRLSHRGRSESGLQLSSREEELLVIIEEGLKPNPALNTPAGATFLDLVTTTLRFLRLTADVAASYSRPFSAGEAPVEAELQEHFFWYLGSTGLGDASFMEVPNVATGRVDVLVFGESGTRFATEVKRELDNASIDALADSYFGQAVDYQVNNEPLGQLLVLDLTDHSRGVPTVSDSVRTETRTVAGSVRSVVIFVVRGNRPPPSAIREPKSVR